MKRQIRKKTLHFIVSEPNDGTRYDYILWNDGKNWRSEGRGSHFTFPNVIETELLELYRELFADKTAYEKVDLIENCSTMKTGVNPFTLVEVMSAIYEIE